MAIRTLFLYTRDQDGDPLFFRSDKVAHFVRGPISDNTTRPCYFTGGPANRPSYTMLPYSTNGDGEKPEEFFTLGLPRPPATMATEDSSGFTGATLAVEDVLYRQVGKQTHASAAGSPYIWPIGSLTPNGLDGVRVYFNVGLKHDISPGHFDDEDQLTLTISLLVDGEAVDSLTVEDAQQKFDESGSRYMVAAGTLRAPALGGARTYALRFENDGDGFTWGDVTRSIYMLELSAYHENTTITVDGDPRFLSAGDIITLSGIGATYDPQATIQSGPTLGIFAELAATAKFLAAYANGSTGYPDDRTTQTVNGTKQVIRTTSNSITVNGAWPWNLTAGGAGGTIEFSGLGGVGDPSAVQGIGYVVTFLTTVGKHVQEGPPSAMSPIITTRPGLAVTLTGLPTGTTEEGNFRFSGKRLYRSNITEDGIGILQFVAELPMEQTTFVDTVRAVDLGEELQTETWIMPPSDMFGLVACHNGMLAGISGNEVCVSVPFQPHAWPVASRFKINDEPVALVATGEAIVVLTKGRPAAILGFEPESMRVVPIDAPFPCLSPEGAVSIGEAAIYPSTTGLVAVPVRGVASVITEGVMEKEEWAKYHPETMKAAEHFGKYLAFYEDEDGDKRAFLLDPRSRVASIMDLSIAADACCTDEEQGRAMFCPEDIDDVYLFDPVEGDEMAFVWRSKTYTTQRPWCPAYGRVVSKQYPVFFKLFANSEHPGDGGDGDDTEGDMQLVFEKEVTNSKPFALPSNYLANAFEIELSNVGELDDEPAEEVETKIVSVGIASTILELLRD